MSRVREALVSCGALAAVGLIGGCARSGAGTGATPSSPAAAVTTSTSASASASAPTSARLHILSPRPGAETGATVTVHVAVSSTRHPARVRLLFTLDGRRLTPTSSRFVIRHLAPGSHRLRVSIADHASVHGSTIFVVRAPAHHRSTPTPPPTSPAPPASPTTETQPIAPVPTTGTPAPPPPTTPATSSSPTGIPQGNGGDGDGDNTGGPSDGDGNV